MDYKNYEVFWEDQLQIKIDKKKGKKIYLDDKKYISFYTPTTISSFRSKTFSKEPDTIKWLNNLGKEIFYMIRIWEFTRLLLKSSTLYPYIWAIL